MRRAAIAIACTACAASRPPIAPPVAAPPDAVVTRLDQEAVTPTGWVVKPRWSKTFDLYEPATVTDATPLAVLIHDAGGDRRELAPLAHHLARHGVRVIVPVIDHDDPDFYGVVDTLRLQLESARAGKSPPTVLIGHGAGGYVAARMAVQSHQHPLGGILIAPAVPQHLKGQSIGYAGDDTTRMVQLDVEHSTGSCTADATETTFGMTRNYRTRAKLAGTTYCGVLGATNCAARCGGAPGSNTSEVAFEAVARIVVAWTSDSAVSDSDQLAALPTAQKVTEKHGQDGSDEWATIGMFAEAGASTRDEPMTDFRRTFGLRLDYHPWPTFTKLPKFARKPEGLRRWGVGGYGEVAWQNDERANDDFRIGGGIALSTGVGSSHVAFALGANALLGQTGAAVGLDATLHFSEFFAARVGTTFDGPRAVHGSLMLTIPWQAIAIIIPFVM